MSFEINFAHTRTRALAQIAGRRVGFVLISVSFLLFATERASRATNLFAAAKDDPSAKNGKSSSEFFGSLGSDRTRREESKNHQTEIRHTSQHASRNVQRGHRDQSVGDQPRSVGMRVATDDLQRIHRKRDVLERRDRARRGAGPAAATGAEQNVFRSRILCVRKNGRDESGLAELQLQIRHEFQLVGLRRHGVFGARRRIVRQVLFCQTCGNGIGEEIAQTRLARRRRNRDRNTPTSREKLTPRAF